MRVLIVGATGTIGGAVAAALAGDHEVVGASRRGSPLKVDVTVPASVRALYAAAGPVDAVVVAAGDAKFGPLEKLTDADLEFSLRSKLMGQVNAVRYGIANVRDRGSFTVTSGILRRFPTPGGSAFSLVNGALEAFVAAAALDLPRGIRINAISPPWVAETLKALGRDPDGGLPAATVARAYVESITGSDTGRVIELSV